MSDRSLLRQDLSRHLTITPKAVGYGRSQVTQDDLNHERAVQHFFAQKRVVDNMNRGRLTN